MSAKCESVSFEPENAEELRRFLEANKELGLIDSRSRSLNDKYAVRFTKRKAKPKRE